MIFSYRRKERYNFVKDKKKNKLVNNVYGKKNYHPYILHSNVKNYRNNNRYWNNCKKYTDCSLNCATTINKNNPILKYEKIYGGLDFQYDSIEKKILYCKHENYKIPTIKNRTTIGMVEPKYCSKLENSECKDLKTRGKCVNKLNPYVEEFNKYRKYKEKKCDKKVFLNDYRNFRYSSYSNYLKKKRTIR